LRRAIRRVRSSEDWLAKLAVKPVLGGGIIGLLANLSSAGTTLLLIHFVTLLKAVQVVRQTTTL